VLPTDLPPPADVIVEKVETDPVPVAAPPPPTVIGNPVAVTVIPAGAFNGGVDKGDAVKVLKPPAPPPAQPPPPPPATTKY
tara:strand:- start:82 stop:324 length:243 start_codon:yes stop_codon:yes gene_type:complete